MAVPLDYIFVDESGDPGYPGESDLYILSAVHMDGPAAVRVRQHIVNFRYHHGVTSELKDYGALFKDQPTQQFRSLLSLLRKLTAAGDLSATTNWLQKERYVRSGGKYLGPGESFRFRNYHLARLLRRHRGRRTWGPHTDLVVDRYPLSFDERRRLHHYLQADERLQPPIECLTLVDSTYTDLVQLADLYTRLTNHTLTERTPNEEVATACDTLMSVREFKPG